MADDGWRTVVLLTIRETPNKKKEGSWYGTWVVARVKPDGTIFSKTVRSGESYTMSGERRYPKEGLTWYDFEALRPIYKDKVEPLIDPKRSVVIPPTGTPTPPPPPDEIEECPF